MKQINIIGLKIRFKLGSICIIFKETLFILDGYFTDLWFSPLGN